MNGNIRESILRRLPELVEVRHHLHQHPELSNEEHETAQFIADRLTEIGAPFVRGVGGGEGIVVDIDGPAQSRRIALRADFDALPIPEATGLPYASCRPGVMHACGHDGHTTMMLGAVRELWEMRDSLPGSVRCIFQPAEEKVGGAGPMCEAGVLEGVSSIVALHGWPGLAIGKIGVKSGPMMAASDTVEITIHGRGGHAAYPHLTVDPVVVAAHVITALQTLVSRTADPSDPAVVTIGSLHAGAAHNVIAEEAKMLGTVRTFSPELRTLISKTMQSMVAGIAESFGATATVRYHFGPPSVTNDAHVTEAVAKAAGAALGPKSVVWLEKPSMGAEDFAEYVRHVPGTFVRVGLGDVTPLHTPTFDFADAAIPVGIQTLVSAALALPLA